MLGNCAAGFGVCCVFSVSASGTTVTENSTYIINPSYPSNYVPTSTPNTLTYTIAKCQDDICRVRLDFDTFELTSPSSGGVADEGQCDTDMLAFTTTAQAVVPTTGSTGTYGSYPYICGTNTGKKKTNKQTTNEQITNKHRTPRILGSESNLRRHGHPHLHHRRLHQQPVQDQGDPAETFL